MIRSAISKSLESYTIGSLIIAILVAAALTKVPALAFGTFWQMAAAFTVADLLLYIAMKSKLIRPYRALRQR